MSLPDTPWDQPTEESLEFSKFLSGKILHDAPWNRIPQDALCV